MDVLSGLLKKLNNGVSRRLTGFIVSLLCFILVIYVVVPPIIALSRIFPLEPRATRLFEDREGQFLSEEEGNLERYGFWTADLEEAEKILLSLIAIEDKRFYLHGGVDLPSVARAVWHRLTNSSREGASTLAMQTARLLYPAPRTWWNKVIESWSALFYTNLYGREWVLRQYLKHMPQGNRISGVAYASRRYFKKPLVDLSWAEAAYLSSLPKAPGQMNPFTLTGHLQIRKRAMLILQELLNQEYISEYEYRIAVNQLNSMRVQRDEIRPEMSMHFILELLDRFDSTELIEKPFRTTLDPRLQDYLSKAVLRRLNELEYLGAGNMAVLVADVETGDILAYIGSSDYFDKRRKGAIDYVQVPRSSGSTLKPFLYAYGLEAGHFTPASVIPDIPLHLMSERGEYTVLNSDDLYLGPMLYRNALANSRNVTAVRVLESLGIEAFHKRLVDLGLIEEEPPASHYGYGLTLGGAYVSLFNLVEAYGVLAREGREFSLKFSRQVLASKDERTDQQILERDSVKLVSMFLSDPLARLPSFPRLSGMEMPFPVAMKTGTSQGYRDAWAAGYSKRYVAAVWIGHPDNESMNHIPGVAAADFLSQIFSYIQEEAVRGIDQEPFYPPAAYRSERICALSGQLPGEFCPNIVTEYFPTRDLPVELCDVHQQILVDKRSGTLPGPFSRAQDIENQVFVVLAPEYAVWSAARGYGPPGFSEEFELPLLELTILRPLAGSRIQMDPSIPSKFQTIPLQIKIEPPVSKIQWWVDGELYQEAEYPYTVRWPLQPGVHAIQARMPNSALRSELISFEVFGY
jgi:penicillin-binding protein 1C